MWTEAVSSGIRLSGIHATPASSCARRAIGNVESNDVAPDNGSSNMTLMRIPDTSNGMVDSA